MQTEYCGRCRKMVKVTIHTMSGTCAECGNVLYITLLVPKTGEMP